MALLPVVQQSSKLTPSGTSFFLMIRRTLSHAV